VRKLATLILLLFGFGPGISWCADSDRKPILRIDLTKLGFAKDVKGLADYTTVGFLSDDLILVAINQRSFNDVDPLFADKPDSTIVIFDISERRAISVARMPLFKGPRAVAPALNKHFLTLTLSEVKLCSTDMQCDRSFPTRGPLWVSWKRDTVVVGGNMRTQRLLLDSQSLMPLEDVNQEAARISAEQEVAVGADHRRVESIANADGHRLMRSEASYTSWNKMMNPLGSLGDRPYNRQQVTVYDQLTSKEMFRLHWDPRPGMPFTPAISPTGHRIAIIVDGTLEVLDIQ